MKRLFAAALVAGGMLAGSVSTASAAPVNYQFAETSLSELGLLTGTFTFDASLNLFTNIDINLSGGSLTSYQGYYQYNVPSLTNLDPPGLPNRKVMGISMTSSITPTTLALAIIYEPITATDAVDGPSDGNAMC